jgi:hypothetical protein
LITSLFIALIPSPDSSGKPFEGLLYFFLAEKSDLGSSFFALEKNNKTKKLGTDSRNSFLKKINYNL